jgi:tetratricopeptide (TPR) repeat protein
MDMLGMQQKEAGILNIKRCLKYNPYSLQAYYALAVGYMNIGDMKNATDTWYRLLALVDGYPKAYYYLGNIYQMQGKYKDAIESYKKEIAFNRYVVPEAYNNLGHVYMKVGKIDNAIQEYSMAIRLYPKAEIFYCNLAYAYIQRGDIDAAEGVLIEALKINPDNKKVMYQLGEIYRNRGRYKEAEQMYKKIISEFGTSSDDANDKIVARAKQKLELLKLKTSNL